MASVQSLVDRCLNYPPTHTKMPSQLELLIDMLAGTLGSKASNSTGKGTTMSLFARGLSRLNWRHLGSLRERFTWLLQKILVPQYPFPLLNWRPFSSLHQLFSLLKITRLLSPSRSATVIPLLALLVCKLELANRGQLMFCWRFRIKA